MGKTVTEVPKNRKYSVFSVATKNNEKTIEKQRRATFPANLSCEVPPGELPPLAPYSSPHTRPECKPARESMCTHVRMCARVRVRCTAVRVCTLTRVIGDSWEEVGERSSANEKTRKTVCF